jgi:peptidoglycan/LPS O-acetylase OafA/YrhL
MQPLPSPSDSRMRTLDLLRGIAAVVVCWCHFSPTLPTMLESPMEKIGATGVPIFFVISGFIIPWGLIKAGYVLSWYPRFFAKRMLRLHPPYLLSLALTLVLSFLAAKVLGKPMHDSFQDVLLALVYLKFPPENPVYWTLGVELQYYITLGLLFPLIFHTQAWVRQVSLVISVALSTTIIGIWDFAAYMPFFALGFLVVWYQQRWSSVWVVGLYALPIIALCAHAHGVLWSVAGVGAATLIAVAPDLKVPRPFLFLGTISYSLYLIHFPIGIKAMNLLMPRIPEALHPLLFLGLTLLVIVAAWIFYLVIERPAVGWSARLKLRRATAAKDPAPPTT